MKSNAHDRSQRMGYAILTLFLGLAFFLGFVLGSSVGRASAISSGGIDPPNNTNSSFVMSEIFGNSVTHYVSPKFAINATTNLWLAVTSPFPQDYCAGKLTAALASATGFTLKSNQTTGAGNGVFCIWERASGTAYSGAFYLNRTSAYFPTYTLWTTWHLNLLTVGTVTALSGPDLNLTATSTSSYQDWGAFDCNTNNSMYATSGSSVLSEADQAQSLVEGMARSPTSPIHLVSAQGAGTGCVGVALALGPTSYTVKFTETGLVSGKSWTTEVGTNITSGTSASLSVPKTNGTYPYTISSAFGVPTPTTGNVTVSGANVTISVTFVSTAIGHNYTVKFSETGLHASTIWDVSVGGANASGISSSLSVLRPNGTYGYTVGCSAAGAAPAFGTTTVSGANVSISVTFSYSKVVYNNTTTVNHWNNQTVNHWNNTTVNHWNNETVNHWDNTTINHWDNTTQNHWDNTTKYNNTTKYSNTTKNFYANSTFYHNSTTTNYNNQTAVLPLWLSFLNQPATALGFWLLDLFLAAGIAYLGAKRGSEARHRPKRIP